jgi:hypothetical protein
LVVLVEGLEAGRHLPVLLVQVRHRHVQRLHTTAVRTISIRVALEREKVKKKKRGIAWTLACMSCSAQQCLDMAIRESTATSTA